jgi:Pectinesterase/Bacterial Ig-like domain/Immunoglobulin domain
MNIFKPRSTNVLKFLALLGCAMVVPAFAQLQWNSYNINGVLVTAGVASGGDSTYGGSVTFTIPATTQLEFATKTFVPMTTPAAGNAAAVTFNISMSGSISGRCFGYGLFNDPGTTSQAMGYWGDFNAGSPAFELFQRNYTNTTYMSYDSANAFNSGKVNTGTPAAGVTYSGQMQVNNKSGLMQIGTSSSTAAAAGLVCDGSGVTQQSYGTTPKAGTNVNVTTFNEFSVMFNNSSASPVTLTLSGISLVPPDPVISAQPLGYSGSPGDNTPGTDFAVTMNANSATPLVYQWYQATATSTNVLADGLTVNGSTITGSRTADLSFTNAQPGDSANYFVVITNAYGSATSSPALLNIASSQTAPVITSISTTNATVIAGQSTNITVVAIGSPTPVYYWYDYNNNLIQSGASSVLTLANVAANAGGTYSVTASNLLGTASTNFTINVIVTPAISSQPANLLLNLGDPANFSVTASGVPSPSYQWYMNNTLIPGATATNYSIANVAYTNIGKYSVVVSNAAGFVTSSNAVLAINSAIVGSPLSPANNATGVCYDTPLYISFNEPVAAGNAGQVRIYNVTNSTSPVDTIDMSLNAANGTQARTIGGDSINTYPVMVNGNTAGIYPHLDVLTSNQTYYVVMDPGVIVDTNAAYFTGISATNVWQFTTKTGGPLNPANLVVNANGSGDFVTVQGAVDSIPSGNTAYTLVNLSNADYVEMVDISGKSNLTFRGQSRAGTIVGYPNNNSLNGSTASRMAIKVNGSDIKFDNLTITNSTPQGGSQAEALTIYNNGLRCVVNNCTIASLQDTVLINAGTSQGYFYNSKIIGNYDYVWGQGVGYFYDCVLHTVTNTLSTSYNLTVARTVTSGTLSATTPWVNPNGTTYSAYGFSLVNCTVEADPGVTGISLADANGTAGGLVSWSDCLMDTNAYVSPPTVLSNSYVFWQNNNQNITATGAATFTNVQTIGVTNNDPRLLAATNVTTWFSGWQPQIAPNILTNPVSQSVSGGGTATFTVVATGIAAPTYQWLDDGSPISGQTNSSLTILDANANDAGLYSVIVSNGAGVVTSSSATLMVSNTAPVLAPVSGETVNVGVNISITNAAYDPDVPAQTLAFTLLPGSPGSITDLNATNGVYTWRPTTAFAGTVNPIQIVVTDNGTPPLSATNSFSITVNPLTSPAISAPSYSGGQFSITVTGQAGPDYELQATTNLLSGPWVDVAVTNSPASPFTLTDPNAAAQPAQFYRVVTGPPLP